MCEPTQFQTGFEYLVKTRLKANQSRTSKIVEVNYSNSKSLLNKPINFVTGWTILDVDTSESSRAFTAIECLPKCLLFDDIAFNEKSSKNQRGKTSRSDPVLMTHDDYVFESVTEIYVLIGPGIEKTIDHEEFRSKYIHKSN